MTALKTAQSLALITVLVWQRTSVYFSTSQVSYASHGGNWHALISQIQCSVLTASKFQPIQALAICWWMGSHWRSYGVRV